MIQPITAYSYRLLKDKADVRNFIKTPPIISNGRGNALCNVAKGQSCGKTKGEYICLNG